MTKSMNAALPATESPDIAQRHPELSAARAAAIGVLTATGWGDEAGEKRHIQSVAHALFLHSAGVIDLPD